jgi:8-oxo-dGTP diphosphatase
VSETLIVAAAIVDSLAAPTRLVSARRVDPPRWAGWWEFPGGKVEPGETPVAALHRELAEELGISVRLGAELPGPVLRDGARAWPIDSGLVMRVWLAEVSEGVPTALDDHDDLRWLGAAELGSVNWLPGNVGVLDAVRHFLAA